MSSSSKLSCASAMWLLDRGMMVSASGAVTAQSQSDLDAAPADGHQPASTPTTKSIVGSRICSISVSSGVIRISRQRLR